MKQTNKLGYFRANYNILLESFKSIDKRMIYFILFDLAFVAVIFIAYSFLGVYSLDKSMAINLPPSSQLENLPTDELKGLTSQLYGFLIAMIIGFSLMFLIAFLSWCIFRGLIWFQVAKKRFTTKIFLRFFILNIYWLIIWLALIALLIYLTKESIVAAILAAVILLFLHYNYLLYILFAEKHFEFIVDSKKSTFAKVVNVLNPSQYFELMKKTISLGTSKIYFFILPYFAALFIFIIIGQFFWVYQYLPDAMQSATTLLIIIIYAAWARIYLYKIVEYINKNN